MSRQWTMCKQCNRVLWVEDGPICPECEEKKKKEAENELKDKVKGLFGK